MATSHRLGNPGWVGVGWAGARVARPGAVATTASIGLPAARPSSRGVRSLRAASTKRLRKARTGPVSLDHRFEVAGEAAALLEEMGFVAVARKRAEVVSLDFWRVVGGQQRAMRHVVDDEPASASALAQICAAEFKAALPQREA